MKRSTSTIVFIAVWICIVFFAGAQTPIMTLNEKTITLDLWGKNSVEYLEDTSQKLTLNDFLRKDTSVFFNSTSKHSPDFGFTDADYWIRFRIQKQTDRPINWVLQNDYQWLTNLLFF